MSACGQVDAGCYVVQTASAGWHKMVALVMITSQSRPGLSDFSRVTLKNMVRPGDEARSSYCQLIRAQNKEKRLAWAQRYRTYRNEDFEEVIFTDACMVQLETHCRFCCRKCGESPKPKPKYDVKQKVAYQNIHML